jgi:hypothetical protein
MSDFDRTFWWGLSQMFGWGWHLIMPSSNGWQSIRQDKTVIFFSAHSEKAEMDATYYSIKHALPQMSSQIQAPDGCPFEAL